MKKTKPAKHRHLKFMYLHNAAAIAALAAAIVSPSDKYIKDIS